MPHLPLPKQSSSCFLSLYVSLHYYAFACFMPFIAEQYFIPQFVYLFTCWRVFWLSLLFGYYKKHCYKQTSTYEHVLSYLLVGLCGRSMLTFSRNCQNVFQNSSTILYSYQHYENSGCSTFLPTLNMVSCFLFVFKF